ncbi:MAG: hypothetical protein MN733_10405 [Nitrososphaera sp.]|nr:hypothetical protein [Nitrososphaera sp.]
MTRKCYVSALFETAPPYTKWEGDIMLALDTAASSARENGATDMANSFYRIRKEVSARAWFWQNRVALQTLSRKDFDIMRAYLPHDEDDSSGIDGKVIEAFLRTYLWRSGNSERAIIGMTHDGIYVLVMTESAEGHEFPTIEQMKKIVAVRNELERGPEWPDVALLVLLLTIALVVVEPLKEQINFWVTTMTQPWFIFVFSLAGLSLFHVANWLVKRGWRKWKINTLKTKDEDLTWAV